MPSERVTLSTDKEVDPPGPFSVSRLLEDVATIQRILTRYTGEVINLAVARAISARVSTDFDDAISFDFMFETLHQYDSKLLDKEFIQLLALQLAGRRADLRTGPLTLFTRPIKSEWVALELTGVEETVWRDNEPGQLLRMFAFSGHPSGHRLTKKVPARWLNYLAYQVGFSRTRRYDDLPWTLIGTRFWGYLAPDEKSEALSFLAWFVTPPFLKMNREIIKFRTRYNPKTGIDKPECPYEHSWDCNQCPQKEHECPGSIHRRWTT